jgi:hypothetical protein
MKTRALRSLMRQRAAVNLKSDPDQSVVGILWDWDSKVVVLKSAVWLRPGQEQEVQGTIAVPVDNVDWVQVEGV